MSIEKRAAPWVTRMCAGARLPEHGGGSSHALLLWCREHLPEPYRSLLPHTGTWPEVIGSAEVIRGMGIDLPTRQAEEAAVIAKAISLAVSELRSGRTRPRQRRRQQQDVYWALVGACQLCQRAAPGFRSSAMTHFCSLHQVGTSAYKRAQPRREDWERHKAATYAGYVPPEVPWRDYRVMPFRDWLEKWFPQVAARYAQGDAESLVAALDDGAGVPRRARRSYRARVLESAKALGAFLVDAESWWAVDPLRGGGPVPPREG